MREATQVQVDGKEAKAAELKVGMRIIQVVPDAFDPSLASSIQVVGDAAPHPATPAKAGKHAPPRFWFVTKAGPDSITISYIVRGAAPAAKK